MANYQEIDNEISQAISQHGPNGVDIVRREKLKKISEITGKPLLLYGVEMFNLQKINATRNDISIDLTDKDGL